MKTIKIATLILLALALTVFITIWRAGAFAEVKVTTGAQGGYLLLGSDHQGSYQKIGSVFNKVKAVQQENKLDSSMFVGVYFDDPGSVEESKLRSFAAFEVKDSASAASILKTHKDFHLLYIPKRNSYFTELETDGMISMIIAAVKAYPKLGEAIRSDRVSLNSQGMAFEEYHLGFTRFVMQVD